MGIAIRAEGPDDRAAIGAVNRLAFGREEEVRLVEALRAGGFVRASLVAEDEDEGRVVGHILLSELPIAAPTGEVVATALVLAPLAVTPSHQRRGIGSMLVREDLRACRERGHRSVVVLGHSAFYPRFGLSAAAARPLKARFSGDASMALELIPGSLAGVEGEVRYPPPFGLV